jgi:hypothetical protein
LIRGASNRIAGLVREERSRKGKWIQNIFELLKFMRREAARNTNTANRKRKQWYQGNILPPFPFTIVVETKQ